MDKLKCDYRLPFKAQYDCYNDPFDMYFLEKEAYIDAVITNPTSIPTAREYFTIASLVVILGLLLSVIFTTNND